MISFANMGNYRLGFRHFAKALGFDEVILPPMQTIKTLKIGSKYSPESACLPFKYTLGTLIESLELGANVLIQPGGICRLRIFSHLQKQIIKDLGYNCDFFTVLEKGSFFDFLNEIKSINPKASWIKVINGIYLEIFTVVVIDYFEKYIRKNIGFAENSKQLEKYFENFLFDIEKCDDSLSIFKVWRRYNKLIKGIKINKKQNIIKVGIIGELYSLLDPCSNFYIEKELGKYGVEVNRKLDLTSTFFDIFLGIENYYKRDLRKSKKYLKYHIGSHGTETIANVLQMIENGYHGAIHMKPFGCMPEVTSMAILQKISKDYKFPIMYISYDEQTSETGIKTRLEAFYDMIKIKNNL